MSFRARATKYRHMAPDKVKIDAIFNAVPTDTAAADSNGAAASSRYVAFVVKGGHGVGVVPLGAYGKHPDPAVLDAGSSVTDMAFNPFNPEQIAYTAEDGALRVGTVPNGGKAGGRASPGAWSAHSRAATVLRFHPLADGMLATGGKDKTVALWDLAKGKPRGTLSGFSGMVWDLAWSYDGTGLATSSKDHVIRIWDPRSGKVAEKVSAHGGSKAVRLIWAGRNFASRLISLGGSKSRNREINGWDPRYLNGPLFTMSLDSNNSLLTPVYDHDTDLLYVGGRGDSSIRVFEGVEKKPMMHEGNTFNATSPLTGLAILPKLGVDVMSCEINRLFRVTSGKIDVLRYKVPSRYHDQFRADLYPQTLSSKASLSAKAWYGGKDAKPVFVSLKPAKGIYSDGEPSDDDGKEPEPEPEPEYEEVVVRDLGIAKHMFKNVNGKVAGKARFYDHLQVDVGLSPELNMLKANGKYWAVPWKTTGGSAIGIGIVAKPGRVPSAMPKVTVAEPLNDFNFAPWDDRMIALGDDSGQVHVTKLPKELDEIMKPSVTMSGHGSKTIVVDWVPNADGLVATGSADSTLRIWNAAKGKEACQMGGFGGSVDSISWAVDGSAAAVTSRDRKLSIADPRSGKTAASATAHAGSRIARALWWAGRDRILTIGTSKSSERQIFLWDVRSMVKPMSKRLVDTSSSVFVPIFDPDTGLLVLTGKGSAAHRLFEIDAAGEIYDLDDFMSGPPALGVAALPKAGNNIKGVEVLRILKLVNNQIHPVSFSVPRARKEFFQDDVFPPILDYSAGPALSAAQWLGGKPKTPPRTDLCPSGMTRLSKAPAVKKAVRKRNTGPTGPDITRDDVFSKFHAQVSTFNEDDNRPLPQDLNEGVDESEWSD